MSNPADWAVVTGAGSGIGAALVQALSTRGVRVVLVGRRADRLRAVQERLAADALVVPADIASAQERARLLAAVEARLTAGNGKLRHLVHNAGIGPPSPDFAGTDPAELERAFAVNVTAPLALTQAFLPALRRAAPARILMVGAGIADRSQPGTGIYGITKKALARLFEQMVTDFAHEAHADLPAVALFQPGLVETEGLREHVAAAQACDLPHAAWLDKALRDGQGRRAAEVADAMAAALLDRSSEDFHGQVLRPS